MSGYHITRRLISTLAVAAIVASCGGSDDSSDDGAATDSPGTAAPTETAADEATDEPTADAATDSNPDDATDSGSTTNCDAVFSMAEVEEFFGEPAALTEETNDDIGQLVCTWETIEDPDDLEDLAAQSLLVQFYSGSPIEASAFFDVSMFDSATPIEGIGDVAYATGTEGMDYFFVDEPVSGSLNYFTFDLGSDESQVEHTPDDVEQLFRLFHDRVT